ncbi:alpha/beta hydrolase [Lacinutrix sp. C3R15]|uniref:alpha/beta hydrolase n=1 Tax=Flavobacteriaceae TaxID=49546 RepID=UPI001C09B84C|nr:MULTISPECIES: alpha/beta hydrolase [Flavobacteriaceae]MBU2939803.1 alpha/beta hydrolase [Lacinutrix sp. C3R15]MDO6623118.1 alpha/beta hydrolase [Oceanihabitans sp. 1_MG-2023]
MKTTKICLTLLLIAFSIVAKGQVNFVPDSTLTYKSTQEGDLKMDVFKPSNYKASNKRPVIIFFFGGGWVAGHPKQFYQQARYFSDKGYVAISAEYRVHGKHKTTPFESVTDGKSAIRWLREHAEELDIDPNKIIASGASAGGHVAACTGVIKGFEEDEQNLDISSLPNAMILFNPVIDTTEKGYGLEKVGESRKTEISPCDHVIPGIPPTLIFHGTADKTVPFENVERFTKQMHAVGNICELVPFEGKGHGYFNGSFFRNKKTDEIFNSTMNLSIAFLKKHHFNAIE